MVFMICGSFSNQVDGLHQQIVVKVFVEVEQKVETDFARGKWNDQSGNLQVEVFVIIFLFLLFNLNIIIGHKMRSTIIVHDEHSLISHFFGVDELESLFPNVVKRSILSHFIWAVIMDFKNPYISEVNEATNVIGVLLFPLDMLWVVAEGRLYPPNGGRLLIFARINNAVLVGWASLGNFL